VVTFLLSEEKMKNIIEERNPWLYFIVTFAISWLLWLPSVLAGFGVNVPIEAETYTLITVPIGAFAPMIAAIILISRKEGGRGVIALLRRAVDFRTPAKYYLLALGLPILFHAIPHYLAPVFGLEVAETLIPEEMANPYLIFIPYFLFILFLGGGQEEFGWRGYALEPLTEKVGPVSSSLIIGIIWGLWHLPLWFMPGDGHARYSFVAFVIFTSGLSFMYTWLYYASGRKLITMFLMHAMSNTAAPYLPYLHWQDGKPETAFWLFVVVTMIFGLFFAYRMRNGLPGEPQPAP
jgi:membrane protease YdiL (CAAX protease family)